MTYEKAIEKLKDRYLGRSCYATAEECNEDNVDIDMAIKALKKQIPKQIVLHGYTPGEACSVSYVCPNCDKHVGINDNFCKYCGQAFERSCSIHNL